MARKPTHSVVPRPTFVQGFITSMNLPPSLDELLEWCGDDVSTAGTVVDVALNWEPGTDGSWTAPAGVRAGDIAFLHYAARARARVVTLRREAARRGLLSADLGEFLEHAEEQAARLAGTVFACALVAGPARPQVASGYDPHWRSRLYAPLSSIDSLEEPLALREHEDSIPRPHKTITELSAASFESLKQRLQDAGNHLPEYLRTTIGGREDFAGITADTWRDVSCRQEQRFANETDIRGYLADYLLEEIKDLGTHVFSEVRCVQPRRPRKKIGARGRSLARGTPIVDYLLCLDGEWIPVETKLSLWSWPDLLTQIGRYVSVTAYKARRRGGEWVTLPGGSTRCMVIDQEGVYLAESQGFVSSAPGRPLWPRADLADLSPRHLRLGIRSLLR
jgi:hypothetical protein